MSETRPPLPPFDLPAALRKVQAAEDAKWQRERDYALRKALWGFRGNRIAVRFQYEWHDDTGQWWRSYGGRFCAILNPATWVSGEAATE